MFGIIWFLIIVCTIIVVWRFIHADREAKRERERYSDRYTKK